MSDIFREVDEDVRRDRLTTLWRRYWKHAVGAAALAIVVAVGVVGWQEYRESQRRAEGERFTAALEQLDAREFTAAADALAELGREASPGYAAMAQLAEARALIEAGDREAAVIVYDRLSADGGVDFVYRELGALFAAQLLLDSAPRDEIERRLGPLALDGKPWRHLARELLAVAALRAGAREEAMAAYSALAEDAGLPAGMRTRVEEMLAFLGAS